MTAAAAPAAAPVTAGPTYDFAGPIQQKVVALLLRDNVFAMRADRLIDPSYLENAAEAAVVSVAQDYFAKYRSVPDGAVLITLINDAVKAKRIRGDLVPEIRTTLKAALTADLSDKEFVLDKVAEFARNRAVEQAILQSVHLHEKGEYAKIEQLMRQALDVGKADEDPGYDYYEMAAARTKHRIDVAAGTIVKTGIPTGYPDIDKHLYHNGWGRKELSVFMGAAKSGKSIGLHDLAKNANLIPKDPKDPNSKGYNVLDLTLEISKDILADRIDANLSETMMNALGTTPFDVQKKVEAASKRAGHFKIHEYASGTLKCSAIRRLLESYRAKGIEFDLLVVDYADLMAPEVMTDSNIENSKSIYIGLRAIAFEYGLAVLTATQTNRDGAKSTTAKATDVAEDYNRVRIADILITINATEDEKRISEARLHWAASRNSEDGFSIRIRQDRARMKFIAKVVGRE
jgi:replicative DNA helicase